MNRIHTPMKRVHIGRRVVSTNAQELDGTLLRLCEVLQQTKRELDAVWAEESAMGIDDPAAAPFSQRRYELLALRHNTLGELSDIPARTPEGVRAKAAVTLAEYQGEANPDFCGSYEPRAALVASLARDVLGGSGA